MIPNHLAVMLRKYRSRGAILDSNLLVLLIMGLTDPSLIAVARPTRNKLFSTADFELLVEMLSRVGVIVTTPHILAETSNLLDQVKGRQRDEVLVLFAQQLQKLRECFLAGAHVVSLACFADLGLTDSAVVQLGQVNYLTITIDAPLASELARRKQDVINFNYLRSALR